MRNIVSIACILHGIQNSGDVSRAKKAQVVDWQLTKDVCNL